MNEDRMTPEALAEIEGKAKKCADNKLPAFALVYSTERELALDAVPQMAAEIRRAWAELEAAKRDLRLLSDEYKFCNLCKYHNGEGVDTCSHLLRFSCDAENFYEWRGAPDNTPAQGATDEVEPV